MSGGQVNPAFVGSAALGRESIGLQLGSEIPQLPADPSEYAPPVDTYDICDLSFLKPEPRLGSPSNDASTERPSTPQSRAHDIVVVGAGISGLFAARCLQKEGLDVMVVEARDRVGGRSQTIRNPHCGYADLGAGYFGHSQTKVLELARELGLELQSLNPAGDAVVWYKGTRRLADLDSAPTLNPFLLMDINHVFRTLDTMSKQVPPHAPWLAEKADEWDKITVADFVEQLTWSEETAITTNLAFSLVFAMRPTEVSLLFGLAFIRSAGGVKNLFSSRQGLQHMKMKGGTGQLSERMARDLQGHIMLRSPACSVHQYSDYVIVRTTNNNEFRCKRAIMALSPQVMKNIDFQPPIPSPQRAYMEHKAKDNSVKTFMVYDKPYWRADGLKGELLSDSGIVMYALEDTKTDGRYPAIMGFADAAICMNLTRDERRKQIAKHYADAFEIPEMNNPSYYIERFWDDPDGVAFSGNCVHTLPPGFLTKHRCLWGVQHQKVHFAGTEASITYRGYMDGAVRASEKAAKEVLDGLHMTPRRTYDVEYEEIPYLQQRTIEKVLPSVKQCIIISSVLFAVIVVVVIVVVVVKAIQAQN